MYCEVALILKKITIKKMASELNLSYSTVYKALNNAGGVSYRNKKKIFDYAAEQGYALKNDSVQIGIILPSSPQAIWQTYLLEITERSKQLNLSCQHFLYENEAYPDDVMLCLESAEKAEVEVLILGLTCSAGVKPVIEKIKSLAKKIMVIFVEELHEDIEEVYVGEHSYQSAQMLAQLYMKKNPQSTRFLAFSKGGHSVDSRVDGFQSELQKRGLSFIDVLKFPEKGKAMGAKLARILNKYRDKVDCIFCASESISDMCLAIRKARISNLHCVGFDCTSADMAYFDAGILKCVARQNIPLQAQKAVEIANRYITEGIRPDIMKGESHAYIEDYFISS